MILVIVIALFSVIALMVAHEFGHFIIAKRCGIRVDEFGIGYPPRLFGKKIGQTLYSINLIPLGAFVRVPGEDGGIEDYQSFVNLSMRKRVAIILGGVISFWVVAIILFSIVFSLGVDVPVGDEDTDAATKIQITKVLPDTPAAIAGIQEGDVIKWLAPTGASYEDRAVTEITKVKGFQDFITGSNGAPVTMGIERNGKSVEINVIPRVSPPEGQGSLGIQLERTANLIPKTAWYMAPYKGIIFCGDLTYKATVSLVQLLANLFSGKGLQKGAELSGPVGLMVFIARAAEMGVGFFLYFIAAISVLLAIFNLLPIPALDGGKLLFMAIEKIKGKPVSPKTENSITSVFFFVLIGLSLFVTVRFDIPKLIDFVKNGF